MQRKMHFWVGLLLTIVLIGAAVLFLYQRESERTAQHVRGQARETAAVLRQQFATIDSLLFSLRNELQNNIRLAERGLLQNPVHNQLHDIFDLDLFAVGEPEQSGTAHSLCGTLTGRGRLAELSNGVQQEIDATLVVDGLFDSALVSLPELKWVYYTSARLFVYVAPKVSPRLHAFSEAFYRLEYWTDTAPQGNPQQQITITAPYNDVYGKGRIISVSIPVYVDNRFRGVVSLDLGVNTLQKTLYNAGSVHTLQQLFDRKRHLIVDSGGNSGSIDTTLSVSDFVNRAVSDTRHGQYHYILPVSTDGLWLVAQVPAWRLLGQVLWSMMPGLLMLLVLALLLWMLHRLRQANRRITELSRTDYLTGISNRRAFWSLAERILQRQAASGNTHNNVFIMIDIDHFKSINDRFGHPAGDRVLQQVVAALQEVTRTRDLLCRLGGEEFGLMLPDSTVEDCRLLAERLRQQVEALILPELGDLQVTISLGCTAIMAQERVDGFIKRADNAMYHAKQGGRNRVVFEADIAVAKAGKEVGVGLQSVPPVSEQ